MNSIAPFLLRCTLAIALLMGGLPAWGASAMTSQVDTAVAQDADDGDESKCHTAGSGSQHDAAPDEPVHDCCEKDADCNHESCRCVCPATSPVVPVRVASATLPVRNLPPSVLTAPAPRDIVTTLLRPPRA